MKPREELNLILKLIRKYNLPLSPILEYAVNEKKDEYPEVVEEPVTEEIRKNDETMRTPSNQEKTKTEVANIILTRKIIEDARTPNGGFTRSQLAAIGVEWPAPQDWIATKIGTLISEQQLEDFNRIEYTTANKNAVSSDTKNRRRSRYSYLDSQEQRRMDAVYAALLHYDVPVTPRDIARTISISEWGEPINVESVDSMLKRMPTVEYIQWGKYILKSKYIQWAENILKSKKK